MSTERISYLPTDGLTYDPQDPKYWEEQALQKEVTRVFEVCHGCRMCFKYCDSFPALFKFIDENHDGDVNKVTKKETDQVMNSCFQCKLCEVQCPYTPRDKHEFQLDFPNLVHRYQAQKYRKEGAPLRDELLARPALAGRMARMSFGVANSMNRVSLHRWFLELTLGISKKKLLPDFANSTFEKWAEKAGWMKGPKVEAVLFQTCYVDHNEPQIGRDTISVLDKNQVKVGCEKGLQCCGMPAWEHGDLELLRKQAHHNIDKLSPFVESGSKVLAINPTCSMMMRKEYPHLVSPEYQEKAKALAEKVQDPSEFLWSIREEERFNTKTKRKEGVKLSYHAPCHLRAQNIGFKARDLMKKLLGIQPTLVAECCGHNGTYAMKKESFEASARIGERSFSGMKAPESEIWATDCPLAAIQFEQHAGVKPMHPMSVLADAYRAGEEKERI